MKKTARTITVLARYQIKQDCPEKGLHTGDVVLFVENSEGKRYYTTLRRNKAHSCTCKANAEYSKKCYHISLSVELENTRYASRKSVNVVSKPAQPVEKPKVTDISTRGALNGNRGFSILRIA